MNERDIWDSITETILDNAEAYILVTRVDGKIRIEEVGDPEIIDILKLNLIADG